MFKWVVDIESYQREEVMRVYSSGEEACGTLGGSGGLKARRLIVSIRNFSPALFSRAKTSEFSTALLSGRFHICRYNGNVLLINFARVVVDVETRAY